VVGTVDPSCRRGGHIWVCPSLPKAYPHTEGAECKDTSRFPAQFLETSPVR